MRVARLVADLPKIKAALATGDGPTVQPLAEEWKQFIPVNAQFFQKA